MPFKEEQKVLSDYIRTKSLKNSEQRQQILDIFLKTEKHLTAEELYLIVKAKSESIGYATIYRTLKLFVDAGLCSELQSPDGITRYEHLYNHKHHDHLICMTCGKFIEILSPEIEALQEKIALKHGFVLNQHRLDLYGTCSECNK
ncbi:transcriptional repressor [bacterium]|nr:transcriptional repressor [bacterium]